MQDNVLTLAVDEENDGVDPVNHVYTRFTPFQNRTVYIHSAHELDAREELTLYRTFPKQNGNFKGTAKCSAKFTSDQAVDGVDGVATLTSPIIAEVSFSIPVGVDEATQMIARQRLISLLDDDDIMGSLMNQLDI